MLALPEQGFLRTLRLCSWIRRKSFERNTSFQEHKASDEDSGGKRCEAAKSLILFIHVNCFRPLLVKCIACYVLLEGIIETYRIFCLPIQRSHAEFSDFTLVFSATKDNAAPHLMTTRTLSIAGRCKFLSLHSGQRRKRSCYKLRGFEFIEFITVWSQVWHTNLHKPVPPGAKEL
jgi:hypothetical protein